MDQNVSLQQVHRRLREGVPIEPSPDSPSATEPASSQRISPQRTQILGLVTPSYLLRAALIAAMVTAAGILELLANTRMLAALLAGGIVALCEAIAACVLYAYHDGGRSGHLVRTGIAWQILIFPFGVYLIALGLRNAGAVDWLVDLYKPPDIATIGVASAVRSVLINNHSMASTNIVAIGALPGGKLTTEYLAALVGGDLGPRLLPIGSLAGLLWYAVLGRSGVHFPVRQFIRIGVIATIPSLTAGLLMLGLSSQRPPPCGQEINGVRT